jgi:small subunit ribosomal protein S21
LRQNNNKQEKRGLHVEVRNGDFNFALRKFKKKVAEDGVLQELRQREFFEKPSITRAKAKKAGRARWLKKLAQMNGDLPTISGAKRKR